MITRHSAIGIRDANRGRGWTARAPRMPHPVARVATAVVALTLVATVALPAQGRVERDAFTWDGRVPEGRWITVRNLRGAIEVVRGSGDRVEVTATRRTRRGDADFVRFEVQKYGVGQENVLVCALWGENADCSETTYRFRSDSRRRNDDVTVDLTVRVPRGVRIGAHTVNGDVRVDDATADVEVSTANGNLVLTNLSGRVNARATNGSVRATMAALDPAGDLSFATVNGSVIVEFTGDLDAQVELVSVNGRFMTDYPVTITGRIDPRRLRATLGKGGPRIRLTTVNGHVELRRR